MTRKLLKKLFKGIISSQYVKLLPGVPKFNGTGRCIASELFHRVTDQLHSSTRCIVVKSTVYNFRINNTSSVKFRKLGSIVNVVHRYQNISFIGSLKQRKLMVFLLKFHCLFSRGLNL